VQRSLQLPVYLRCRRGQRAPALHDMAPSLPQPFEGAHGFLERAFDAGMRIPGESGRGFRREGGHPSGVKATTHSDAKAATLVFGRVAGMDGKGGRLPVGTSDAEGSEAMAFSSFKRKGGRCRHGDSP
jgi:hypothetical protein